MFDPAWKAVLSSQDADPRFWDLHVKWEHHMRMAEILIDHKPQLAELWLKGADHVRKQMILRGIHLHKESHHVP